MRLVQQEGRLPAVDPEPWAMPLSLEALGEVVESFRMGR